MQPLHFKVKDSLTLFLMFSLLALVTAEPLAQVRFIYTNDRLLFATDPPSPNTV